MPARTGTPTRPIVRLPGFINMLYGIRIPHRDGKPLGGTEFSNMHLAYEALPAEIKTAFR
jgi:taurine dioxygenase